MQAQVEQACDSALKDSRNGFVSLDLHPPLGELRKAIVFLEANHPEVAEAVPVAVIGPPRNEGEVAGNRDELMPEGPPTRLVLELEPSGDDSITPSPRLRCGAVK